jgi:hypothetical protein
MNMNASRHVWMIYFVGFDESTEGAHDAVEPLVGRERVAVGDDPESWKDSLELAALLRGGRVMAVVGDDETQAEHARVAIELQVMRYR